MNLPMKSNMKCKLCDNPCEQIDFCYGCNNYICDSCNTYPDVPGGKHSPDDHLKLKGAIMARTEAQEIIDAICAGTKELEIT